LSASSVFLVEDSIEVIGNLKPQNWAPNFSPISHWIFPKFSGWKTPGRSSIHHQKIPPKLLPVSSYLKGKVRVWGTPNHLKWDFGAKNGKNDSLPKSIEIINFRDFLHKFVKNADNLPEGSTEISI